jgi:glutamate dehydrogenase
VRLVDETDADVPTFAMAFVAVDQSYGLRRLFLYVRDPD